MNNSIENNGLSNFVQLIKDVAQTNNLEIDNVTNLLGSSIKKVFLKDFPDNKVDVKIDLHKGKILMWRYLRIVDDEYYINEGEDGGNEDDETLIPYSKAKEIYPNAKFEIDDYIRRIISIDEFDKSNVRAVLNIFKQLTIEAANKQICEKWKKYEGIVLEGEVEKIDHHHNTNLTLRGAVIKLVKGNEIAKGYITSNKYVHTIDKNGNLILENLIIGQKYLFYVEEVHEQSSGWPINLNRTHGEIVKELMKKNIPEINEGIVEIMGIARLAGFKTKVLVHSKSLSIDPIGACVGQRGNRLKSISSQLLNEKIDVVEWSSNPIKNIIRAMIPCKILGYSVINTDDHERRIILITKDEDFLSGVGKKGGNIRLVSMLNQWSIDLKRISEAKTENIDYELTDFLFENESSNMAERVYKTHYKKNEEILHQFDREKKQTTYIFDDVPISKESLQETFPELKKEVSILSETNVEDFSKKPKVTKSNNENFDKVVKPKRKTQAVKMNRNNNNLDEMMDSYIEESEIDLYSSDFDNSSNSDSEE